MIKSLFGVSRWGHVFVHIYIYICIYIFICMNISHQIISYIYIIMFAFVFSGVSDWSVTLWRCFGDVLATTRCRTRAQRRNFESHRSSSLFAFVTCQAGWRSALRRSASASSTVTLLPPPHGVLRLGFSAKCWRVLGMISALFFLPCGFSARQTSSKQ